MVHTGHDASRPPPKLPAYPPHPGAVKHACLLQALQLHCILARDISLGGQDVLGLFLGP